MPATPAIVVIAYNRHNSLARLLESLSKAHYDETSIPLIISIDKSDNPNVLKVAQNFVWDYGSKKILQHQEKLGLKKHVLLCGDLSSDYGSIIMLEDDLYVSPYFYDYSKKASDYYSGDENIAGVSLYNHSFNETALFPFHPINDGSDVYFLKIASSWGQLFWCDKWGNFKDWYRNNNDLTQIIGLPAQFINWSDSSWKKYYIGYLVDKDKYFVYPNISLTTNFSDEGGQNIRKSTNINQIPFLSGERKWVFKKFNESEIKYDAFCEINAEYLKKNNPELVHYDFEVDLYGCKPINKIVAHSIITSKPSRKPIIGFGMNFKSLPLNISLKPNGSFFTLSEKNDCYDSILSQINRKIKYFIFFYRKTSIKMYFFLIAHKLFGK